MFRYYFNCELLENVVLPTRWATTLSLDTLDYLPGNLFRGVFAKDAHENPEIIGGIENYYNGSFRFGDGHLLIDGKRSLSQPTTWFYQKGKSIAESNIKDAANGIILGDQLTEIDYKLFAEQGIQPKQTRTGFFSRNDIEKKIYTQKVEGAMTIKTAYDTKNRSSKDAQLFTYYFINAGQTFQFFIESKNQTLLEWFKLYFEATLIRLGRSKNVEFGLARTSFSHTELVEPSPLTKETYLYCETPLCLVDKYGAYTSNIDPKRDLGIEAEIDLFKSKIVKRQITLWNGKRQNWDRERAVIEKGSVIVLKVEASSVGKLVEQTFGVHRAEGYGSVLVNPIFLQKIILEYSVEKRTYVSAPTTEQILVGENHLFSYLETKYDKVKNEMLVLKEVAKFKKQHAAIMKTKISASQWGMVNQQAVNASTWNILHKNLFDHDNGALYQGQSKQYWIDSGFSIKLKTEFERISAPLRIDFIKKLSREMAKTAR